ncbi:hypothetical protein GCM10023078_17920 [Gibbsiella greigii]
MQNLISKTTHINALKSNKKQKTRYYNQIRIIIDNYMTTDIINYEDWFLAVIFIPPCY